MTTRIGAAKKGSRKRKPTRVRARHRRRVIHKPPGRHYTHLHLRHHKVTRFLRPIPRRLLLAKRVKLMGARHKLAGRRAVPHRSQLLLGRRVALGRPGNPRTRV